MEHSRRREGLLMSRKQSVLPGVAGAFGAGIVLCFVLPVKVLLLTAVLIFILALCAKK